MSNQEGTMRGVMSAGSLTGSLSGSGSMSLGLSSGSIIVNDYTITLSEIEGGHRLTVKRGGQEQTMDLLDGAPFTYDQFTEEQLASLQGPEGKQGEQGETGPAATLSVGTVTTTAPGTQVEITNSGDEHHAVLNFKMPGGAKGDTGTVFVPSISEAGVISWTNEGGLENPTPVSVKGDKGEQGDAFTYSDFTPAQLAALKGEKGDAFTYSDFTPEQLAALKGEKGEDGSNFTVSGLYASLAALRSAHPTGSKGDAYAVGTADDNTVYLWSVDKAAWENVGKLQGAKGETGTVFTPQITSDGVLSWTNNGDLENPASVNIRGPKGDDGAPGAQGDNGAPGVAATIQVGTVTTGEAGTQATVVNAGDNNAAILNFTLPKGDKGEKGDQGEKGEQGDKGSDGSPGVQGNDGDDGATFIPSVSTEGILSWTNDKGLDNPSPVNIKGVDGGTGPAGEAATVSVGTVSSGTTPSVTNTGTTTAAVLNFVLPKGDPGSPGTKGEPGSDAVFSGGTTDLVAGESILAAGSVYFVYE